MLAKVAEGVPEGDGFLFEPKWDGFRAIVFCTATDVFIQSRDLTAARPLLSRPAPSLSRPAAGGMRARRRDCHCHPGRPRLRRPAAASAPGGLASRDPGRGGPGGVCRLRPPARTRHATSARHHFDGPRAALESLLALHGAHLPDPDDARPGDGREWFRSLRGGRPRRRHREAGLRHLRASQRVMFKIKHVREATASSPASAGTSGANTVGSLLLGLYDAKEARCIMSGVTSAFTNGHAEGTGGAPRAFAARLRLTGTRGASGRTASGRDGTRMRGGQSRWSAGKDLSWERVTRIERVVRGQGRPPAGRSASATPWCSRGWRADRQAGGLPLRPARGHGALRAREGLRRGGPSAGLDDAPPTRSAGGIRIEPLLPGGGPPARARG